MENPYLYWYLIFVGVCILHGIIEGFANNMLKKASWNYSYSREWLEMFHNINLKDISHCARRSGRSTYLCLNLINKVQISEDDEQIVAIVKKHSDIKYHVDIINRYFPEHGIKLLSPSSQMTFQVEYEGKRSSITFIPESLYAVAYDYISEGRKINLIDY